MLSMAIIQFFMVGTLAIQSPDDVKDTDWSHWRGPHFDGRALAPGLFKDGFGLSLSWKMPLGSSYSGISVSNDMVVALGSDGTNDFAIALHAEDGLEAWRFHFGATYRGHDGSKDGPLSTPLIHGDKVFTIDAQGRMYVLELDSGNEVWTRDFREDFGAEVPEYGFTTTPIVHEELVIVQVGGVSGTSVCAFHVESGDTAWTHGDGSTQYQSPSLLHLAGVVQLVVLGGDSIYALEPSTGKRLWFHELGERSFAGSGIPTPMGPNRFFAYVSSQLTVFEVHQSAGEFDAEEVYRSRDIGGSYAAPVYHDGQIYGYRGDFLTCVEAKSGKRVWRSRPPGGRGLILIDDRLVMLGAEGVVVIAKASKEGYQEEARIEPLTGGSYSWPAFAKGRIFVRNFDEIAAIEVSAKGVIASATEEPQNTSSMLGLREAVEKSDDPQSVADAFVDEQGSFPVLEGNRVHFFYRGDVEDIAIGGSMTDGPPEPMVRLANTNLYHRSYEIEPGARWEYRFQLDYGRWIEDPLNPHRVPGNREGAGFSEVLTPEYSRATHLNEPSGSRGSIEFYRYKSERLNNERDVKVYLPFGYHDSKDAYSLLIVHQGISALENSLMKNTLDNLIGKDIEPLVVVFLGTIDEWWYEGGGTRTGAYVDMLALEFVPDLEKRFRLRDAPDSRAVMGYQSFGITAAYAAMQHSEVFGKVAIQSLSLEDVTKYSLFELIDNGPIQKIEFYIDWNRYASRNSDNGTHTGIDSKTLFEKLKGKGYKVKGGEALDGFGWGSFRARNDQVLKSLFPRAR